VYVAPRGTIDILPEDQPYWHFIRDQIRTVTALFGYQRLDVPVFEETSLYVRGVGQGTDIVDKEMYSSWTRATATSPCGPSSPPGSCAPTSSTG
jgi:histidyl-tRNA synthetase